jgi:hypothetical protein
VGFFAFPVPRGGVGDRIRPTVAAMLGDELEIG